MKLKWYKKYEPTRYEAAKGLFINEVSHRHCRSWSLIWVLYAVYKLRPYGKEPASSTSSNRNSRAESQHVWADSILELSNNEDHSQGRTLKSEVAAYLADLQIGTSILIYW